MKHKMALKLSAGRVFLFYDLPNIPQNFRRSLSFKIRFGYCFPQVMRQVAVKYLPYKVDRPDDVMNDGQYDGMIIIPTYQHCIDAKHKVDNAPVPVSHER